MDLTPYVQTVRDSVTSAASLADDHTREVAERLGGSIESSTRLALIAALADATSTISAELAPSSVEVRMVGQDPELVVSVPKGQDEPTVLQPPTTDPEPTDEDLLIDLDDEPVARISLRLPQSVKTKVDEVAAADGISTNAWLTRAVMDALAAADRPEWPRPPVPPTPGVIFGPHGPFGPHGVFGPHGPFGPGGLFGEKSGRGPGERPRRPGRVQGWVR